jgi:pimeloyl-ACP methyl ester carboxylesterase
MKLEILNTPSVSPDKKGTIVFCHGAWHDARCWQPTMMPFFAQQGYDCIAPSYRNHGNSESSGSLKFRRISEYVADIQSVVENIEGRVFLIGHSMGGFVVQKYLEKYPNRIEKAILLCSIPPQGVWRVTLKNALYFPLLFFKVNLFWTLKPYISTLELFRLHFYTEGVSDAELKPFFEQTQDESYLAFLDMLFWDLPKPSKIKTPLMVIGGGKDYLFPPADVLKTAKVYGVTAYIFENEAHNLFLEKNWHDAATEMLAFLNG